MCVCLRVRVRVRICVRAVTSRLNGLQTTDFDITAHFCGSLICYCFLISVTVTNDIIFCFS